jgi:flagellar hook-associated protein 1
MGLLSSLHNAVSGLSITQASMDLVSRNVANAGTVGYTRRVLNQQETSASGITAGAVRQVNVSRVLDQLLQKNLRSEATGAAYSSVRADYLQRVDTLYGQPGAASGINQAFANFSTSIQQLAADPASSNLRNDVLSKAQSLVANLNGLSTNLQQMRGEIEARIGDEANAVNGLLEGLDRVSERLMQVNDSATRAGLLDERDKYVDQLANHMDIVVSDSDAGGFNIYTTAGAQVYVEGRRLRLGFDERFAISADSLYNANPAQSGVGQLFISDPYGGRIALSGSGNLRSGSFAALLDLRDRTLVEAQGQLDEFAAALASTLGDRTVAGAAATVGAASGFDLDLNALQSGNIISLDYTITPAGTRQKVSFIAVNDPGSLPLAAGATADPTDLEVGIDFSGGIPNAITAIGTALGGSFAVSHLGGGVMRLLDDGAGNTRNINSLFARATNTALTGQGEAMPFFVDGASGNAAYTGSFDGQPQRRGFAGGIKVNAALLADPSRLVVYNTSPLTPSGDTTRASFLRDQLQSAVTHFTPSSALTGSNFAFSATTSQFLDRIISTQSQAANNAAALSEGQNVVVSSLRERFADESGVNVDQELADLIELQNTYSANARIVSAVKDMFDVLMRI